MPSAGIFARRDVLAGMTALGGVALWSGRGSFAGQPATALAADHDYASLHQDYDQAFASAMALWWDADRNAIRPTNGGDVPARAGLIDYDFPFPSFWQMECLENAIFSDWQLFRSPATKTRLAAQWRFVTTKVPAFTPKVLGGDGRGITVNTSDDAAWHCWYLMHAHMALGDTRALAWLAEATAATRLRFADADPGNPRTIVGRTPGGLPIVSNRYGMLYAEENKIGFGEAGKISTSYEAVNALAELYVHAALGLPGYRESAAASYRWIYEKLRTPPQMIAARAAGQPVASRKAEGMYETTLCLARSGGVPEGHDAHYLEPAAGYFGKPIRSLDSTYLDGALAMGLLAARLAALPETPKAERAAYRAEAVHIANMLASPNAYGRDVGARRLIANTRDPWSDAHVAVPFAREVLSLPGVDASARRAFADTAVHILAAGRTADNRLTADWSGPERNFTTGRSSWEEDYRAHPGQQAGAAQIMTEGESLAMVQAGVVAAGLT